ncbi:MAG: PQQ-binding-like beta-propeller repeat protein [Pirellulaceae bacterium]
MTKRALNIYCCWIVCLAVAMARPATAADWPQLLGPTRNGVAQETLPNSLGALKPRWTHDLGGGFAGPVVSNGSVIVFHRENDQVLVECLEVNTGEQKWVYRDKTRYEGGYNSDNGPRSAPVISGNHVFAFGPDADLHCLDLKTGKRVWKRQLGKDYRAPDGYFGAGSTPLVVEDLVYVCLGGRMGAGAICLNAITGETVWKSTDDRISYSSPVMGNVGGKSQLLFLTRQRLVSLAPASGEEVWALSFGLPGLTVTGCTPLICDDQVFLTASYNIGAAMIGLKSGKPTKLWGDDQTLSSQYTNVVFSQGFLYGTHGREDAALAEFRCIDAKNGDIKWRQQNFGVAHAVLAGDKILLQRVKQGEIVLLAKTPSEFNQLDSVRISSDSLRAPPALANGVIFTRTHDEANRGKLLCLPLPK